MSKQQLKQLKQAGFTIIEVVLVLAIAALIFLMVFIALPALQRSQRDDARKKDITIVSSSIASWEGNNRNSGTLPTEAQLIAYSALSDNTANITPITAAVGTTSVTAVDGKVAIYKGYKCSTTNGAKVTIADGTTRQYALITLLEAGGGTGFCLDS